MPVIYSAGDFGVPENVQSGARPLGEDPAVESSTVGWGGGRLMFLGDRRGGPVPGPNVSTRLRVESYNAGALEGRPFIIAKAVDEAGLPLYFGPITESKREIFGDRSWPGSDWSRGLSCVCYQGTAAGYYAWCEGRSTHHPRKFYFRRPFRVAPVENDMLAIGATLFWVVFGEDESGATRGMMNPSVGEVAIWRTAAGQTLSGIVLEAYTSGKGYRTEIPSFPFRATTRHDVSNRIDTTKAIDFQGGSTHSKRVAWGLVALVDRHENDIFLERVSVRVVGERAEAAPQGGL